MKKQNKKELEEKIKELEKLEVMKDEAYERKTYLSDLNMNDARVLFRIRTRTIKCKMNQSCSQATKASLWKCQGCGKIDTQIHILYCPSYKHLRDGKSLYNDQDLVNYFREVLKLRDNE